jgi:hypothetical protein
VLRMLPLARGTNARTGGPTLGPADCSLLSSAYCGTDAGAATAAMREDARNEDRGGVLVVASYYLVVVVYGSLDIARPITCHSEA